MIRESRMENMKGKGEGMEKRKKKENEVGKEGKRRRE
jgi:hypothetical protein